MVMHVELENNNIIHLMGHGPIKKYRYMVTATERST